MRERIERSSQVADGLYPGRAKCVDLRSKRDDCAFKTAAAVRSTFNVYGGFKLRPHELTGIASLFLQLRAVTNRTQHFRGHTADSPLHSY